MGNNWLVSSPVTLCFCYSNLKSGLCAFMNEFEELPEQKILENLLLCFQLELFKIKEP